MKMEGALWAPFLLFGMKNRKGGVSVRTLLNDFKMLKSQLTSLRGIVLTENLTTGCKDRLFMQLC
jgi:hypothetical protein